MSMSRNFDRIAIALSAVCIVHCLAVPLILGLVPLAAFWADEGAHFHGAMLWLVVPTSVVGFALGYRVHRRGSIVALGVCGVTIVVAAAIWGHGAWRVWVEGGVTVVGSLLLAAAHWQNFRVVRRLHRHAPA